MSMREYPSSGYVVAVKNLRSVLPEDKQEEFDGLLELYDEGDADVEEVGEFLTANLNEKFPSFEVYRPSDEDTVDEPMEQGELYAIFDEDDLYEKKPTSEHEAMLKLGVKPEFARWSVWG